MSLGVVGVFCIINCYFKYFDELQCSFMYMWTYLKVHLGKKWKRLIKKIGSMFFVFLFYKGLIYCFSNRVDEVCMCHFKEIYLWLDNLFGPKMDLTLSLNGSKMDLNGPKCPPPSPSPSQPCLGRIPWRGNVGRRTGSPTTSQISPWSTRTLGQEKRHGLFQEIHSRRSMS